MSDLIISLTNVSKVYDGRDLGLSDVTLSVRKGDFISIVGPSGCGKSTLLKVIAGLEGVSKGHVEKPKAVSMVFQNGALLPWLSVEENVLLGAKHSNEDRDEAERATDEEISHIGLTPFKDKLPRELSGGQRQRVGIARALSVHPEVLLLDEPFSALDPITTEELHKDITKLHDRTGATIIMVTHSLEEAVGLSDRVVLMKNFKIAQEFLIRLPHPRRSDANAYIAEVQRIQKAFFQN